MGGWGLKGSASQCQKFYPGFELPIRKQIPPSHHQPLTPQRYSRWVLGPGRDGPGQTGGQEGTSGQHSSLAQRLGCYPGDLTAL